MIHIYLLLIFIFMINILLFYINKNKLIIKKRFLHTNLFYGYIRNLISTKKVMIKNLSKKGIKNNEVYFTELAHSYDLAPKVYKCPNQKPNTLVTELLSNNDNWYMLYDYEKKFGKNKKIDFNICKGIKKLNKIGIEHNDLQEINIMVNSNNKKVYFIDFEDSKLIRNNKNESSNLNNSFYQKRCNNI